MAVISRILAAVLTSAAAVIALPGSKTLLQRGTETSPSIAARSVIAHDAVVGFAETVPSGTLGTAYETYQPFLKVVNGCVPFPAVDAEGNTSGGLAPTGASDGDCSSSTGQIYSRGETYGDYFAIMYSWYMPKDEPSTGIGHRHDWEGAIVWLTSESLTTTSNIVAVCPSAHGGWDCDTSFSLSGTGPLIDYESIWPIDHSCGLTTTVGGQQPLIAWESLPTAAQTALASTDFGSAIVPFIDAHFETNLAACSW